MEALNNLLNFFKSNSNKGFNVEKNPVIVLEQGQQVKDLSAYLDRPLRIKSDRKFEDIRGFIAYVNDFKTENTVIFAGKNSLEAIVDYHKGINPNNCDHKTVYNLKINPLFENWMKYNDQWQSQRDICDFIEANMLSIVNPSHGELLSIIRDFRANINSDIQTKVKAGGAEELVFKKTVSGGGNGAIVSVEVPEHVDIQLSPLTGFPNQDDLLIVCKARMLFRIRQEGNEPKVEFKFNIFNITQIYEGFIENVKQYISKECKDVKVYLS